MMLLVCVREIKCHTKCYAYDHGKHQISLFHLQKEKKEQNYKNMDS